MDADTRHQLKQNELIETLQKLRDWNQPGTRYTLLGIVVILAAFGGWKIWQHSHRQAIARATEQIGRAQIAILGGVDEQRLNTSVSELRGVIASPPNTGLGAMARVLLARAQFQTAVAKPEQRQQALAEASKLCEEVLKTPDVPASLEAEARFSLATVRESLAMVDPLSAGTHLDRAREMYESLAGEPRFAGVPYADLAKERLENLDTLLTPVAMTPGDPPGSTQPAAGTPGATPPEPTARPISAEEAQKLLSNRRLAPPPPIGTVEPPSPGQPAPKPAEPQEKPQEPPAPGEPAPQAPPAPEPSPPQSP